MSIYAYVCKTTSKICSCLCEGKQAHSTQQTFVLCRCKRPSSRQYIQLVLTCTAGMEVELDYVSRLVTCCAHWSSNLSQAAGDVWCTCSQTEAAGLSSTHAGAAGAVGDTSCGDTFDADLLPVGTGLSKCSSRLALDAGPRLGSLLLSAQSSAACWSALLRPLKLPTTPVERDAAYLHWLCMNLEMLRVQMLPGMVCSRACKAFTMF